MHDELTFNAFEILEGRLVEVHRVAFVERVDLASRWDADVWVSEDEFAHTL